jgi:sugar/nucleoside kinase (ribokinase family)
MWDIIGLGCATLDEMLYIPSFPHPDTKMQIQREERRLGGLTAIALAAAARLGANAAYAGVLGHDDVSRFVEDTLHDAGVDTSLVVRRDDAHPTHSRVIVDTTGPTRTILYAIKGRIGADDELPTVENIRLSRVLFMDDYGMKGNLRAAYIAREFGIPIVADLERDDIPEFRDLLALVDHPILSVDFALKITRMSNPVEAVKRLWSAVRAVVVVTCGADGGWYTTDGVDIHAYPAFPVKAVDTTGCGDVFHGAYAAALARGDEAATRIRFASAAAALKAAGVGSFLGIPTRAEVDAFLASRP